MNLSSTSLSIIFSQLSFIFQFPKAGSKSVTNKNASSDP